MPLVSQEPIYPEVVPEPGDPSEDPFCSFWKGDDQRLHAEICALLDEEHIPHKTIRREDHLFNLNNQPKFQIGVPYSEYERAEQVIHDAFGSLEEETIGSPWRDPYPSGAGVLGASAPLHLLAENKPDPDPRRSEEPIETDAIHRPIWDPSNWTPEDATVPVWSGADSSLGEMFMASLAENEIHSRWDDRKGHYSLHVLPKDEQRAKEIIREIVEGAPQE